MGWRIALLAGIALAVVLGGVAVVAATQGSARTVCIGALPGTYDGGLSETDPPCTRTGVTFGDSSDSVREATRYDLPPPLQSNFALLWGYAAIGVLVLTLAAVPAVQLLSNREKRDG